MDERLQPKQLGFAFYWGWTLLCFQSMVLFMPGTSPESHGGFAEFFASSIVCTVAAHFLWGWAVPKFSHLRTGTPWLAAVLQSAAVLIAGLGAGSLPTSTLVAMGAVSGVTSALMDVRWSQVYGTLPPGTSGPAITLSIVAGGLLYFAIGTLGRFSPLGTVLLIALLPLGCAYTLGINNAAPAPKSIPAPRSLRPIAASLWRPVVGSLVFFFVYGCVESIVHGRVDFNVSHTLSQVFCTLATLVIFAMLVRRRRVSASAVYGITMALVAAGFMLLPLVIRYGHSTANLTAAITFVGLGTSIFDIVLLCAIAHAAYEHHVSGAAINGVVRGATVGFSAVGNMAGSLLATSLWTGTVDLIIFVLAVCYLLIISMSFFIGRRKDAALDMGGATGEARPEHGQADAAAGPEPTESASCPAEIEPSDEPLTQEQGQPSTAPLEQLLDERIGRIAAERGLSPREADVFALMARGRSLPYIAETLVLSENTIRSHTRRVYNKLGVHSKQELLDLVAQAQEDR